MKLYIAFFHGRHFAAEELTDWGFDGPLIGPLNGMGGTYGDIKLDGPEYSEDVPFRDGFWKLGGDYFGDFSFQAISDEDLTAKWLTNGRKLLSFAEFEELVHADIYHQTA